MIVWGPGFDRLDSLEGTGVAPNYLNYLGSDSLGRVREGRAEDPVGIQRLDTVLDTYGSMQDKTSSPKTWDDI